MKSIRLLSTVVILMAVSAAAQSSESTASRQAFLWRSLDSWELNISQAVAMREDPFPSVRTKAVMVMASNVDAGRLPLFSLYMGDGDALVREQVMLAAGRMG